MKNIVIIDSHYLCWRGFYTTGRLTFNGNSTGVLYAFFRDILTVQELYNPDILVFCFEGCGPRVREKIYPEYKKNRDKVYTQEEEAARDGLRMQIKILRQDVLPEMGFLNVFSEDGYEADDLIASICTDRIDDDITIISGDSDLYQLLRKKVRVYNPREKKTMSRRKFMDTYGVKPKHWSSVKAIMGDKSDNIAGVPGVGRVGAIKYLSGQLKPKSAQMKNIQKHADVIHRNIELIKLPFSGCSTPELVEHEIMDVQVWGRFMERFGMKSLMKGGESNEQKSEGFKF